MDINNLEIPTEIRIMLLGDSITQGEDTGQNTFRRPLWQKIQEADFIPVDFVGSLNRYALKSFQSNILNVSF